jgi:hypothetical protein
MKTIAGIYEAVEDGFQQMSDGVYAAFLAGTLGLMFVAGCVISAVAQGLGR